MAAISLSIEQGVSGSKMSDYTVGTLAPGAGDFEVRLNTTNTNSANISREDMILALMGFIRALQQGGATVDIVAINGGSPPPPLV